MADVISEYKQWKQQGESLKAQAREAMEARFRELLAEAVAVSEEYRIDFGVLLKPLSPVTAFRYKASSTPKPRNAGKRPPAKAAPAPPAATKAEKPDPKIMKLKQRLATAKKKLDDAKSGGAPTRPLEDRIYEIEDAIRLAEHPA
jgi:hypothetical protein